MYILPKNNFSPQEEAEIQKSWKESENGENLKGPFNSADDMIADLKLS